MDDEHEWRESNGLLHQTLINRMNQWNNYLEAISAQRPWIGTGDAMAGI